MTTAFEDFISDHGWFNTYKDTLGARFVTFKIGLNLYLQNKGDVIIETGTLRSLEDDWNGDGNSTLLFGEFLKHYSGHLWTCDTDEEALRVSKVRTMQYASNISYVHSDSVAFLREFDQEINLLYLDSLDVPQKLQDPTRAQEHNLEELQAAWNKLGPKAVVVIDDNWLKNGGKGKLSKEFLEKNGWLCLYDWRQTVWMNPK